MSSRDALSKVIASYKYEVLDVKSTENDLSLFTNQDVGLRLDSFSGGYITILSGDMSIRTDNYIWIQSGEFSTEYSEPSSGEVHLVSNDRLLLRSGDDIVISPMPYPTYSNTNSSSVTISGQTDTVGSNPGLVRISGGSHALTGNSFSRAGGLYLEAGKANNGAQGSDTWGGNIDITTYGYGSISQDGYSLNLTARGIFSLDTTTRDSNDDSAFVYISTGDGVDGSSSSGDISIKTGDVFGTPTPSKVSNSGDILLQTSGSYDGVTGSILLTSGQSIEGTVGDIEITTGSLSNSLGIAGHITLQGGSGSSGANASGINLLGGDSESTGLPGVVSIVAGALDDPDIALTQTSGIVTVKGGDLTNVDWANLSGASIAAGSVKIYGGDVDDSNTNGAKLSWGGNVEIFGGSGGGGLNSAQGNIIVQGSVFSVTTASLCNINSGGGMILDCDGSNMTLNSEQDIVLNSDVDIELNADAEVKVNSTSATAGAENLIMGLGSDSVLKTLGVSLLGSGSVTFSILPGYHVHKIPLFFNTVNINISPTQDLSVGETNNHQNLYYPQVSQSYSGKQIITGGVLNYSNIKVVGVLNSDNQLLEIDGVAYTYTTPQNLSGYYYLEQRYSKTGAHVDTNGIINNSVGSTINITYNYLVFA